MPGIIHALSETFRGIKAIRRFSRSRTSRVGFAQGESVSSARSEACGRHG